MTTSLLMKQALDVPPKMVLEIACGLREPAEIAEDYGFSEEQWLELQQFGPFVKAVEAKKLELQQSGYTFRMKSALMAEDLLEDVYLAGKEDGASFHTKLESLKFMARAAGLDAPKDAAGENKPTFSISINLGGETVTIGVNQPARTIDHDEDEPVFSMAFTPFQVIPFEAIPSEIYDHDPIHPA